MKTIYYRELHMALEVLKIWNYNYEFFKSFVCFFLSNESLTSGTAATELTINNKNLQIIGIVDHLANKWGSEDELGEKQSRKMASRNTQSSAGGKSENMKGTVAIWYEVIYERKFCL